MSTYSPNIPTAAENPTDSQPLLQDNFQALNNAVSRNHTAMTDTANSGKHQFLQMPEQVAAPATAANEGGLYTKVAGGVTQLFFREESSGTERQMTSDFLGATDGYARLPGGLLMKWGTGAMVSGALFDFPVLVPATAFTVAPYNIQLTIIQDTTGINTVYVKAASISTTQFIPITSAAGLTVFWTAIGLG